MRGLYETDRDIKWKIKDFDCHAELQILIMKPQHLKSATSID